MTEVSVLVQQRHVATQINEDDDEDDVEVSWKKFMLQITANPPHPTVIRHPSSTSLTPPVLSCVKPLSSINLNHSSGRCSGGAIALHGFDFELRMRIGDGQQNGASLNSNYRLWE